LADNLDKSIYKLDKSLDNLDKLEEGQNSKEHREEANRRRSAYRKPWRWQGGNDSVRVYLVGYIFCIIDCHICRDIFDRIDIMYCRLPYVSRGVLLLKTLVFYIYRPRGIM
jgi:hypothetical protein